MPERTSGPWKITVPIDSAQGVAAAMAAYAEKCEDDVAAALLRVGATEVRLWRDYVTTVQAITNQAGAGSGGESDDEQGAA